MSYKNFIPLIIYLDEINPEQTTKISALVQTNHKAAISVEKILTLTETENSIDTLLETQPIKKINLFEIHAEKAQKYQL
jgi:hypothetical protein